MNWFPAFLPSLNAWRVVVGSIVDIEEFPESGPGSLPSEIDMTWFNHKFDELNRLLGFVLEAYAPADREVFYCSSEHSAACRLLKQYWHYTERVRELAKEVWPKVNLNKLLEQV